MLGLAECHRERNTGTQLEVILGGIILPGLAR